VLRSSVLLLLSLVLVAAGLALGEEAPALDRYGGWEKVKMAATGWFRVAKVGARWHLVDPDGHPFLSIGVNTVSFRQDTIRGTNRSPYGEAVAAKYGGVADWARAVAGRLRGWGFNTIGAWSDQVTWQQKMPFTVILDFAHRVKWAEGMTFPDVFDPEWERAVNRHARRVCRPLATNPWLIGYFTDNELRWAPDWRSGDTLFIEFLQLPDGAPGRQALVRFLQDRYQTVAVLNEAWRTEYESFDQVGRIPQVGSRIPDADQEEFLKLVASRYFSVSKEAIRLVDEHHLILGCRFAGYLRGPVLEAMRDQVEVVSFNHYSERAPGEALSEIDRVTGRPVIISEFSFRARDSGLPNTRGAGVIVDTQGQRAEHFERYVTELMELPMVVGYHWFEHADEPAEGRFDGEDSNYGLVTIEDEPYALLVETMARVNGRLYASIAAASGGQ